MSLSLHRLRIDFIVLFMGAKKPDHHDPVLVLHQGDQSIIIRLDVEDHSSTLEDARLRVRLLYVTRCLPLRLLRNRSPGVVLRP